MRSIVDSTEAFEAWMRKRTDVSERLLKKKHSQMAEGPFPFLRATFYRWVEQWPSVCPRARRTRRGRAARSRRSARGELRGLAGLAKAASGASTTLTKHASWPFTSDLVRLATSAVLAAAEANIDVEANQVCAPLLAGYRRRTRYRSANSGHRASPRAGHAHQGHEEDPQTFWKKSFDPKKNPTVDARELPRGLEDMFRASFRPDANLTFRAQRSPGGLGSLGRQAVHRRRDEEGRARRSARPRRSCRPRCIG